MTGAVEGELVFKVRHTAVGGEYRGVVVCVPYAWHGPFPTGLFERAVGLSAGPTLANELTRRFGPGTLRWEGGYYYGWVPRAS